MPSNHVLEYDSQNIYLSNALDEIDLTYRRLKMIENAYSKFNSNVKLPIPAYTNFRDALFHFVKIYENEDYKSIVGNSFALNEHLQRGLKDAVLRLLNNLSKWVEFFCIRHSVDSKTEEEIKKKCPQIESLCRWDIDSFYKSILAKPDEHGNMSYYQLCDICMKICANVVQNNNPQYIIELRKYMHFFKNETAMIRTTSSIIETTYTGDDSFDKLIKEINNFYEYVEKVNLYHSSIFCLGNMF